MRRITWQAYNGDTVVFASDPPFLFESLRDAGSASAEISKAPREEGQTTYYAVLGARQINLTGSVIAIGSASLPALAVLDGLVERLHAAFRPDKFGTLIYQSEAGERRLVCRPVSSPTFGAYVEFSRTVDVELISDRAYWEREPAIDSAIGVDEKYWEWPWEPGDTEMGRYDELAVLANPTAVTIYPTVTVRSVLSSVTLTNVTAGKAITIDHALAAGQHMEINMRDMTAWLFDSATGTRLDNVSHWLTLDSEPWGLLPGDNTITANTERPDSIPAVVMSYRIPVMGVV